MAKYDGAGILCLIVLFLGSAVPCLAISYTVGDTNGWELGVDYSTWTTGKTFSVGDSLVFNYGGGHTVDEVNGTDYNSCTLGNSISTDTTGATTIALKTTGTHYFVCAVMGHCSSGMKLSVTVTGTTTSPSTGGSTTPSSGGGSTSTAPPTTTAITPPSSNIPASSSSGSLSACISLVMIISVAVMYKLVVTEVW